MRQGKRERDKRQRHRERKTGEEGAGEQRQSPRQGPGGPTGGKIGQ